MRGKYVDKFTRADCKFGIVERLEVERSRNRGSLNSTALCEPSSFSLRIVAELDASRGLSLRILSVLSPVLVFRLFRWELGKIWLAEWDN